MHDFMQAPEQWSHLSKALAAGVANKVLSQALSQKMVCNMKLKLCSMNANTAGKAPSEKNTWSHTKIGAMSGMLGCQKNKLRPVVWVRC